MNFLNIFPVSDAFTQIGKFLTVQKDLLSGIIIYKYSGSIILSFNRASYIVVYLYRFHILADNGLIFGSRSFVLNGLCGIFSTRSRYIVGHLIFRPKRNGHIITALNFKRIFQRICGLLYITLERRIGQRYIRTVRSQMFTGPFTGRFSCQHTGSKRSTGDSKRFSCGPSFLSFGSLGFIISIGSLFKSPSSS